MLKLDYHVHTAFSDGKPDYMQVLERARKLGIQCIAITDHFDRYDENMIIRSLTENALLRHFDKIREYALKTGQKVLCGIETCTDFRGNLRLEDRVVENCDVIITSPHYIEYEGEITPGCFFNEKYWECYKNKVLNMAGGPGDILGHCEGYLPYGKMLERTTTTYAQRQELAKEIAVRFFDEGYIRELAGALKRSGKAVELHCATCTPREWVIQKLVENEIPLSLGSDSHVLDSIGNTEWGAKMIEKYHGERLLFNYHK